MVPWVVLVSALVVSAAAEVVLALVATAEALAGAEAVAEADAPADAEGLEVDPPELPPQAARPKVAARLRDRTAIDFFTADFSFRHASLCNGAVRSVVGVQAGMSPVYALMLAPRPENSLGCRAPVDPLPRYSHSPLCSSSLEHKNAPHASRSDAHGASYRSRGCYALVASQAAVSSLQLTWAVRA